MGRLKQNIKVPDYIRILLQSFANVNANICKINDMTNYPEIAELMFINRGQ